MLAAASVWGPRGGFEQNCALCEDPRLRERWGCDVPTEKPHTLLQCPFCAGVDEHCEHCTDGEIGVHRCPWQLVTAEHQQACIAVLQMESGILPAPGGWCDQSASFVQVYPVLVRELHNWREKAAERARKKEEGRRGR